MDHQQQVVSEIEDRAHSLRVSMNFVLQRANVAPSTFTRWKKEPGDPKRVGATMTLVTRLHVALDEIAADMSARAERKAAAA